MRRTGTTAAAARSHRRARTGEALATIKSRLQRGLALLRERLDGDGAGGQWRAAFASAFGLDRLAAAGSGLAATTGTLVMGTGIKVACGGAAAVLAVAALWLFALGEVPPQPTVPADARATAAAPVTSGLRADAAAGERREPAPDRVAADPASSADTVVRGRCVDEQGQPLAGCLVALRGKPRGNRYADFAPGLAEWLVAHPGFRWHEQEAITGADGVFAFALSWVPLHFEVALRRAAEAVELTAPTGRLQRGDDRDLGDLVLPVTCALRCRVVDPDGAAIHLPWINLLPESGKPKLGPGSYQVHLRPDGSYSASVLAGSYFVQVFGRSLASDKKLVVPEGATSFDATIVVAAFDPALTITGTVADERGNLLAGVAVYALGNESGWARTDANGAFVIGRAPDDKWPAAELVVWQEGWAPWSSGTAVRWGSRDQRIVLQRALALAVHVTAAADGRPVEDFALHVRKQRGNPVQYMGDDAVPYATPDHHENGEAHLTGLGPGEHVLVVVPVRADLAPSLAGPCTVSAARPNRVDVALAVAASRLLRVQMPDGAPAADVAVELIDPMGQTVTTTSPAADFTDWDPASSRSLRLQHGRTDARGELPLHGPAGTAWALRLIAAAQPVFVVHDVSLDVAEPLVVTLPRGARLEGTLGPAELVAGLRAAGEGRVAPGNRATTDRPGLRLVRGEGAARETFPKGEPAARVAADGSFAIGGAPPGTWQLALEPWSFDRPGRRGDAVPVATVELRDGQTTEVAIDLPEWLPVAVDGQVLWNGAPLADQDAMMFVRWRDAAGGPQMRFERVRTDRDGRFAVRTRPGSAIVSIMQNRGDGWASLASAPEVLIGTGGIANAVFAIDSGALRLRLVGDDGKPVAGVRLALIRDEPFEGAWVRVHTVPSDSDGWIGCEGDPRPLLVQVLPQRLQSTQVLNELLAAAPEGSGDSLRAHRLTIGTVLPRRGETTTVELRLPPEWYR